MNKFSSIFSQLLQLFPRIEFQHLVNKTQAERGAKGFTCWAQFVSMEFCQLGRAHSLRENSSLGVVAKWSGRRLFGSKTN